MAKQSNLESISGADGVPSFDFRGVLCPLNFVRTKIELEKVDSGQKIRVTINAGEPMRNVPRSVKLEGHEILATVDNADGSSTLLIQRNG